MSVDRRFKLIDGTSPFAAITAPAGTAAGQYLVTNGTGGFTLGAGSGGAVGANPTAEVELTAVNGTATTFMRSDASPPLDQTIVPTMTGAWTFTPSGLFVAMTLNGYDTQWTQIINGSNSVSLGLQINAGTSPSDTAFQVNSANGTLMFECRGDGYIYLNSSSGNAAIYSQHVNLLFGNTTDNQNFTFQGSGTVTIDGPATITGVATLTSVPVFTVVGGTAVTTSGGHTLPALAKGYITVTVASVNYAVPYYTI